MSNLAQRLGAAALFGPVLLMTVWYGGLPLLCAVGLFIVFCLREFGHMLARNDLNPWILIATCASLMWCGFAHVFGLQFWTSFFPGLFLLLLCLSLFQSATSRPLANLATTLFGILYIGFLSSFIILVRNGAAPDGGFYAALILSGIWASDVAAYFFGRRFGRRHPVPHISPGKTEAGFIGGCLAAVAVTAWAGHALNLLSLNDGLLLGLIVGIGAPIGDLFESMIKREMGVKDTSQLIPGHGGLLDRFDSVLFVFPLAYFYLQLVKP
ncbi:MAG: phosphatidate cytidylyltransferase [bacterium]|nr:phosphatidate cytidylyltransferase [bacterium]